jgi:8-oxo-dGTP diphosphatase
MLTTYRSPPLSSWSTAGCYWFADGVAEGALVWQLPAGKMEPGESAEDAAVREAGEETGLTVRAVRHLGERVHPLTGRTVVYVACEAVARTAYAAAEDEIAEVAWCDRVMLTEYVPHLMFGPVQEYLDATIIACPRP